jgi:hypothetical protein
MAWKHDLAKLKQQLPPEPAQGLPKPAPKPVPRPTGPAGLEDEDAVFLSAMGLKPSQPSRPSPQTSDPVASQPALPSPPPPPESFEEALKDLKGLKPMGRALPGAAHPSIRSQTQPPPATVEPEKVVAADPPPLDQTLPPLPDPPGPEAPPLAPAGPLRFQLAAGMAIEVDGSLDLRGHTVLDAMERLRDRLGDGLVLGWRSLQVILGTDPILHEGLLGLLGSGQLPMVARYAQAPIPMGGNQAWLLYFVSPSTQP